MATTFKAFNTMLTEFFGDLADTFDEYTVISDARTMLEGLLTVNPETDVPMKTFIEVFRPHSELVMSKDAKLFEVCQIPMISDGGFDMSKEWKTLEDDNREAIWNYIQQLFLTGTTVLAMSGDMLNSIESLAKDCMDKVGKGELTEEDAQNPMVILQEMTKNKDLMNMLNGSSK